MSDYIPTNGAASTRWLTEEVFKLIDLVQKDEAIYNPRHKYYFCRPYVENFWREVDQKLDKNPGASLAKWTNLRISFRREFTNYLEEKVPPCWSYFDRMFFLHPYLRKKQQTSKQGDSSLQETLAQINELSNRLERQTAEKVNKPASSASSIQNNTSGNLQQQISDNYFDYYDEPEQNNSELDEIIDDDTRHEAVRYPQVILETSNTMQHKIKSEHEDDMQEDDYEMRREILLDSDVGEELSTRDISPPPCNAVSSRLGKRSYEVRLEHFNRLQTRYYHDDLRAKRPRSQERVVGGSNTTAATTTNNNQRQFAATTSTHSSTNVSFVRPTVSKSNELSSNVNANALLEPLQPTLAVSSSASLAVSQNPPSTQTSRYYGQRYDSTNSSSSLNISSTNFNSNNNTLSTTRQLTSPSTATTPHVEPQIPTQATYKCDCKTDPDAMFLMSLLPDIQKLNGRDRGKIKIAFQNILQDYLYPD